jgi:hypothetical protein
MLIDYWRPDICKKSSRVYCGAWGKVTETHRNSKRTSAISRSEIQYR